MAYKPLEIDESDIPVPPSFDITNWEPPRHVYFGPKDARGRMAPEPKKSGAKFPSVRYAKTENGLKTRQVETAEEAAALGPEWKESPADFGYMTHPTKEYIRAQEEARGPGRPRKEAA